MATIRPFAAIRPPKQYAEQVSCLPYDVMNHEEACAMAAGNASSYLHICRADIDTSEAEIHDAVTYEKSAENLQDFLRKGFLLREEKPCYYIYRQMMWGRVQTGIVGCASVDEYQNGTIKKHELTRKEKELDRINHFDTCSTQTEPVFLAYRKHEGISTTIREWIKFHKPEYEFTSDDGVTHLLWPVTDDDAIAAIRQGFEEVPVLYIADGHHRTASSAAVSAKRRAEHPDYTGEEEFNYLMAVTFCDEDLFIMDYNRVVLNLNGMTAEQYLTAISEKFTVAPATPGKPHAPVPNTNSACSWAASGTASPPRKAPSTPATPSKAWTAPSSRATCWHRCSASPTPAPANASTSWAASVGWMSSKHAPAPPA